MEARSLNMALPAALRLECATGKSAAICTLYLESAAEDGRAYDIQRAVDRTQENFCALSIKARTGRAEG